jgi:hypothetical protein
MYGVMKAAGGHGVYAMYSVQKAVRRPGAGGVAKPRPKRKPPESRGTVTDQGRLFDNFDGPFAMAPGADGGGSSEMKAGTVKFFTETKGFGLSKLCPGHPSCLQAIPESDASPAMSMGYGGPSLGGSDSGPEYSMIPWVGYYCISSGNVSVGVCCDSNCYWCSIWGGPSENCCSHVAQGCLGGFGTVSKE